VMIEDVGLHCQFTPSILESHLVILLKECLDHGLLGFV